VEPETLSDEQAIVAADRAGRILHIAVDGMLRILGSRSVAKQEFGIERTAISRGDNNPLKFVNTAAEALQMLLCTDLPGFLPAEDAMRETVDDIGGHQLALLAGVQAAVADTMRRLDPAAIEATLPSYAADPLVPALRRARAWEQYRATYADLARSLEEGGREGFGGEFARGYAAIRPAAAKSRTQTSETSPDDH
jgi:type VI secretion system FHA domain protein